MRSSGGSDLNSGSTSSDVASGSDSATYTSTAGNFDGTSVFTPTDNQTTSSFVSVGDYVSLYNTGDSVARAIAKVLTVAAGNNGAITIDTTVVYGTVPTSNSGSRACKKGGSWASLATMASPGALNVVGSAPQSTRINIKAGTYANTSVNKTLGLAGTTRFPVLIQGYKTTPQDQIGNFQAVAGTDIPTITFTTGTLSSSADATWSNIDITGASTGSLMTCSAARWRLQEVRLSVTNATAAAVAFTASQAGAAIACFFSCTTTSTKTVSLTTGASSLHGCVINGGLAGVLQAVASCTYVRCIFYGQAGDCISSNNNMQVIECSFYAPLGNAINITSGGSGTVVGNCYFSTVNQASKAAINNTTGTNIENPSFYGNAFFNNTANYSGFQEAYQFVDNGTLASEAFTTPGSQDFSIVNAFRALGWPGQFEHFSTSTGRVDFGAVQSTGVTSASGIITGAGWQGGFRG